MSADDRKHLTLTERSMLEQCDDCPSRLANRMLAEMDAPRRPVKLRKVKRTLVGEATGKAGERTVVSLKHDYMFRGELIIATDSLGGDATSIDSVLVGCRLQCVGKLPGKVMLSSELTRAHRLQEKNLDTCDPALFIYVCVTFLKDCTFRVEIEGVAAEPIRCEKEEH